MTKKEPESYVNDLSIIDALLRIKAIEQLLISKGVFTKEEFSSEIEAITNNIAKTLLEKANIPGDLDELLKSLPKPAGN